MQIPPSIIEEISKSFYGGSLASKAYMYAVNKYINLKDPLHKKSRVLYDGEYHIPLHNFTGPGTRIDIKDVRDFPPYNEIDACSKQHDLDYDEIKHQSLDTVSKKQKNKEIMKADRRAIECYNKHKNVYGYTAAKAGISGKLGLETLLSMLKGTPTTIYGGLIHEYTDSALYQQRDPKYYTDQEKEILKLLKINKSTNTIIDPIGSFTFSIQKYPSDIDVNEVVVISPTNNGSLKVEGITKFIDDLRKLVGKVKAKSKKGLGIYFSDFKAGKDESGDGIHWNEKDIEKGNTVINDKKYYLSEALLQKSIIKLDIILITNDRILEVSSFFMLYNKDGSFINLDENFFETYSQNLKNDINKFHDIKPFKAVKRLWNLSRLNKDTEILSKLAPLIDSNISLLSQIGADLETLLILLNTKNGELDESIISQKKKIVNTLNSFLKKISNIVDINSFSEKFSEISAKIEMLKEQVNRWTVNTNVKQKTIKLVENIHDTIMNIVREETLEYLKVNNINLLSFI